MNARAHKKKTKTENKDKNLPFRTRICEEYACSIGVVNKKRELNREAFSRVARELVIHIR